MPGKKDKDIKGTDGDDILIGDDKKNKIEGKGGDDEIRGLGGDDHLKGGDGNDQLFGGEGKDHLDGDDGDDFLSGGEGNDKLHGKGGNDTIEGGAGDDDLEGDDGDDHLSGGDGKDKLEGDKGHDFLDGGAGDDDLDGDDGDDILLGGEGKDKLEGKDGNDILEGGAGKDDLKGGKGDDHLDGGDGDDDLKGEDGNDTLIGGAGKDKLEGKDGNDILEGGAGKDDLKGGKGDDHLDGGDGDDKLKGEDGDDTLIGGAGEDKLEGKKGDDVLIGGTGIDELKGDDGDDHFIWHSGDGEDKIDGGKDHDSFTLRSSDTDKQTIFLSTNKKGDFVVTVSGGGEDEELELKNIEDFNLEIGAGGATLQLGDLPEGSLGDEPLELSGGDGSDEIDAGGSDTAIDVDAGDGDDEVTGSEADDEIDGGSGEDAIEGGGGADNIDGGEGADTISGGEGADTIAGGEGEDTISGGAGDDVIDAGTGNDTVTWEAGDGNDVVDGGDGDDVVDLTLDESQPSTLDISADTAGNVILTADDGTQLLLDEVEEIVINAGAAGTSITIGDLTGTDISQSTLFFNGGIGDDFFDASASDRRIVATGGEGDDILLSGSGNDELDGGAGNDTLDAGDGLGTDIVRGGTGNDHITVHVGNDLNTSAIDTVDGGTDADQMDVDHLEVRLQKPDLPFPQFVVSSNGDGSFRITGGFETLDVSNIETLELRATEGALNIVLNPLGDSSLASDGLALTGSDEADSFDASATDIEVQAVGMGGNDNLIGGSQKDRLLGGDGDDSLVGGGGDDWLDGGDGIDILDGGDGHDIADYSARGSGVTIDLREFGTQDIGSGEMETLVNVEEIRGTDFADTLTGNSADNVLRGGDGDDRLTAFGGFDQLFGGDGNDTLETVAGSTVNGFFDGGAGDDELSAQEGQFVTAIGGEGDDVLDTYAVAYWNDPAGVSVNLDSVAWDVFGDGSLVLQAGEALDGWGDTDSLSSQVTTVSLSNFDDNVRGSDGDDYLFLEAGDDTAFGLAGNDTFVAGSGADTIDGGSGVDTVQYNGGGDPSGPPTQGVVLNLSSADFDYGSGVAFANSALDGYGDTDTLLNFENASGSKLDDVLVGTDQQNILSGFDGNDSLFGAAGDDILFGGAGDDSIDGGADNDDIRGGEGDDSLSGGAGADIYRFESASEPDALNFGHDTIDDFDVSEDTLDLSELQITSLADVTAIASESNGNTVLSIDTDRSITLLGVTIAQLTGDNFLFADSDAIFGDDEDNVIDGTEQGDLIFAGGGFDTVNGLGGDDYIFGGDDSDQLFGGSGNDQLFGEAGFDRLVGGEGNDTLNGGEDEDRVDYVDDPAGVTVNLSTGTATDGWGNTDTLISIEGVSAGDFDDTITGSDEANTILADSSPTGTGGGADTIFALDGLDRIHPGGGVDVIDGGGGTDVVYFWAEGIGFGMPGIDITFQSDGSITMDNPTSGETETEITNVEAVVGTLGQDTLIGNAQDNILRGWYGDDTIDGGAGNDTAWYFSGSGVTVDLSTGEGFITRSPQLGSDSLTSIENVLGSFQNDLLIGDANGNVLEGANGDDVLIGGAGNDFLNGGLSTIISDIGSDDPEENGFDVANYSDDPAGISVDLTSQTVIDGWGDTDTLHQIDEVLGSAFADTFVGDGQDNTFEGQQGNDSYTLGGGADTVILSDATDGSAAFGLDEVTDFNVVEDVIDVSQFSDIQEMSELDITQDGNGNDTLITFDSSNVLRLINFTASLTGANFVFAVPQVINGTEANDFLEGGPGNDTIRGFAGFDQIFGEDGDDFIDGGADGDTIFGGDGDDIIDGGGDFDNIYGEGGDDIINSGGPGNIYGGEGNDTLTATSSDGQLWGLLDGGPGDDVLISPNGQMDLYGGPGDDLLDGRPDYSNDPSGVFVNLTDSDWDVFDNGSFSVPAMTAFDGFGDTDTLGAGATTLSRASNYDDFVRGSDFNQHFTLFGGDDTAIGGSNGDYFHGGSGDDTLDGGDGFDGVDYHAEDNDILGPGTQGIVANLSTEDFDYGGVSDAVANTVIDDYNHTDRVYNMEWLDGTEFNDVIIGTDQHNNLKGFGGDDLIFGGDGGGDWITPGDGADYIEGGDGDGDTAAFWDAQNAVDIDLSNNRANNDGFGNIDILNGIENIEGSQFGDTIIGDAENNTFWGNGGDDHIEGGAGHDYFNDRDGNSQLFGQAGDDTFRAAAGDDLLDGGADQDWATYESWTGTTSGINLNMSVIDGAAPFSNVSSTPDGFGGTDYLRGIENVEGSDFDDTIIGDGSDNHFEGRIGDDTLEGGDGDDHLDGGDENDVLEGGAGFDFLTGGENDDSLTGGSDGDTFYFSRKHYGPNGEERVGFGNDIIHDFSIGEDTLDVFNVPEFSSVAAMLSYAVSDPGAPDLVLEFISNDNVAGIDELNRLTLEGISPDDLANMNIIFAPVTGTENDDVLEGTPDNDDIESFGGDDIVHGREGHDWINGGSGNDQLFGDEGNDTLLGGPDSDLLDGGAGWDTVEFDDGSNISSGITVDLGATPVDAGGFSDVIVVNNNGTLDFLRDIENLRGTPLDDNFTGDDNDNNLLGEAGNDILIGAAGRDDLHGGDGNDQLFGGDDWDWLSGGRGDDLIDGGDGGNHVSYWHEEATVGVTVDLSATPVSAGGFDDVIVVANDGTGGTDYLRNVQDVFGTSLDDTLIGGVGHNSFGGSDGNDVLRGGEDNDSLRGDRGDDQLFGEDGDDFLRGGEGDDLLDGGAGRDDVSFDGSKLSSGVSVDLSATPVDAGGYSGVIVVNDDGMGGTDYLRGIEDVTGTSFSDTLIGNDEDNSFSGLAGDDFLSGNGGDDNLWADEGNDTLLGGDGNDNLEGERGDDDLSGGAGNDRFLFSRHYYGPNGQEATGFGSDIIQDFSIDDDILDVYDVPEFSSLAAMLNLVVSDPSDPDLVLEFNSNDGPTGTPELNRLTLIGISADDLANMDIRFAPLTGTEGDDILNGTDESEVINGLGGNDVIYGAGGNDQLEGGTGNDQLFGEDGRDELIGGAGDDLVDGGAGEDWVQFWDATSSGVVVDLGATPVSSGGFDDVIPVADGSGGTDYLRDVEHIGGTAFADSLTGASGHNVLSGGDGDDVLSGGEDNDSLYGDQGNDELFGEDGDDFLRGGEGDDLLDGGAGRDDVSFDGSKLSSGVSVDLSATPVDAGGYSGVIVVNDDGMGGTDYLRGIEDVTGTSFSDTLIGNDEDNSFSGLAGDDFLSGNGGDDNLWADEGNDTLLGGDGNDNLEGERGDDDLSGGAGNDRFLFSRHYYGPNGQEATGFGSDIIQDFSIDDDILDVYDVPEFSSLAAMLNLVVSDPSDPDLVLEFNSNDGPTGTPELNRLTLIGISADDLANMDIRFAPLTGTEGDDILDGTDGHDDINGLGGNDVIHGAGGNDQLEGGAGDDQLFGEDGHDELIGGEGDDLIDGGDGDDWVQFWDANGSGVIVDLGAATVSAGGFDDVIPVADGSGGTDYLRDVEHIGGTSFADTLTGAGGHNVLSGGDGDDVLSGGDNNDSLFGDLGNDQLFGDAGNDFLRGREGDDLLDGGSGEDRVSFDDGSKISSGVNVDLSVAPVDAGGYIGVIPVIDAHGDTDYLRGIESITGTSADDSLTGDDVRNSFSGREGNDTLIGAGGDDSLSGEQGNDTLNGGDDNDWLDGGTGDDSLTGGDGFDTFWFAREQYGEPAAFGDDVINDFSIDDDRLDFYNVPEFTGLADVLAAVVSGPSDPDLVIEFTSTDGSSGLPELNRITLIGITADDLSDMDISYAPIQGTDGPDTITGTSGDDNIQGLGGDDQIDGLAGNDQLDGDSGDDQLSGGDGHDSLRGGLGSDLLDGGDGFDRAEFWDSSNTTGVSVDLTTAPTTVDGFVDVIPVADGSGGTDYLRSIEHISGTNFDDTLIGDPEHNNFWGDDGNDTLHGGGGFDTLNGGQGDDELFGEGDGDWLHGDPGDDLIDGGAGNDTADFWYHDISSGITVDLTDTPISAGGYSGVIPVADGTGGTDYLRDIESISGTALNDTLTGGAGRNHLWGQDGDDVLDGGADADSLDGGDGNDTLIANGDGDDLWGGAGDDTFVLSDGMNVQIRDFEAGTGGGDVIDLSAVTGLTDFQSVLDASNIDNGNVRIDLDGVWDGSNVVELVGVSSTGLLDSGDFSFS